MVLGQNTPLPFLDSNQFNRNGHNNEGVTARSAFALARFCDNILIMKVETLEKQVALLRILVDAGIVVQRQTNERKMVAFTVPSGAI